MLLWIFIFGPALVLFAIPCLLSRRWLRVFMVLAGIGFAYLWHSHRAHLGEGNGVAEAFGQMALYAWTLGTGTGIGARAMMLSLRHRQIRWRYAWLPAPIILGLVISGHVGQVWYDQWRHRPPPDTCLAATHRIAVGDVALRIPTAPVITLMLSDREFLSLAFPPDNIRTLCRRTAGDRVLEIQRLWLNFDRDMPPLRHWPEPFCVAVTDRPWLARICTGPVDIRAEHYPREIVFEASERMANDGAFRDIWKALQGEEAPAKFRRLRTPDGKWLAISCSIQSGLQNCYGTFEPRHGLGARFSFSTSPASLEAETAAFAARVSEIAADLAR